MIVLYRLTENDRGLNLKEGSCISEERYQTIHYLSKVLFEVITEIERRDMIEYDNEAYCLNHNIECVLFYTENELRKFIEEND